MAQPVFDGHPLEEYFKGTFSFIIIIPFLHLTRPSHAADSGEASELMPGGIADISLQPYLTGHPPISKHSERMEKLCFLVFGAVEVSTHNSIHSITERIYSYALSFCPHNAMQSLSSFFVSHRMSIRTQAFAERFKYGVISSSLLSPAFAGTPMVESHGRGLSSSLPGKLSNSHSRTSSAAESTMTDNLSLSMPPEPETPVWPLTFSFTVVVATLSARFYLFSLLLLAATLYYIHIHRLDIHSKPDVMIPVSHLSLSYGSVY
jgi:hypothetical protein